MTERLALEFICGLGMPPIEFVDLAARLDCRGIGLACGPVVAVPELYPAWSLRDDPGLRRETKAALDANGVAISLGEGILIRPGTEVRDQLGDVEILANLGALRINVVSIESDWERNVDQFAAFAAMAAEHGCSATLEYMPGMPIGDLSSAQRLLQQVGASHTGVLVDAMHFFRSGSTVADLHGLTPGTIGYAQVCDVPLVTTIADYSVEARFERLAPGDGELPLDDWLSALPDACMIGIELPLRSKALSGVSAVERLRPAVEWLRERL